MRTSFFVLIKYGFTSSIYNTKQYDTFLNIPSVPSNLRVQNISAQLFKDYYSVIFKIKVSADIMGAFKQVWEREGVILP